jgi:ACS family sodium-dependent inorganic phosphate cotransporter
MFAMSNVGGWMGDALILQRKQSVAAARKTVNTIGKASTNLF